VERRGKGRVEKLSPHRIIKIDKLEQDPARANPTKKEGRGDYRVHKNYSRAYNAEDSSHCNGCGERNGRSGILINHQ